jgi:hypothetical protein
MVVMFLRFTCLVPRATSWVTTYLKFKEAAALAKTSKKLLPSHFSMPFLKGLPRL